MPNISPLSKPDRSGRGEFHTRPYREASLRPVARHHRFYRAGRMTKLSKWASIGPVPASARRATRPAIGPVSVTGGKLTPLMLIVMLILAPLPLMVTARWFLAFPLLIAGTGV